jgi:hypothetical protein
VSREGHRCRGETGRDLPGFTLAAPGAPAAAARTPEQELLDAPGGLKNTGSMLLRLAIVLRRPASIARVLLGSLLLLCLAGGALAAEETPDTAPKIYKWIDENGIAHYTTDIERIPKAIRHQIGGQPEAPRSGSRGEPPATDDSATQRSTVRSSSSDRGFSQDARPEPVVSDFDDGTVVSADAELLADLDARIAALKEEIAGDEEILKSLISRSGEEANAGGEQVAALRTLGDRLPQALDELGALRAERAALGP